MIDLKLGQIWEDCDPRIMVTYPRRVIIERYTPTRVQVRNIKSGRRTWIARRRMRPASNGYKLVEAAT